MNIVEQSAVSLKESARQKGDENAVGRLKPVGLNVDGRAGLAVVSRRGEGDEVAPLHGSGHGKAASMNSRAPFRIPIARRAAAQAALGRKAHSTA